MKCPVCGQKMIWDSDADYDDLGIDGSGMVSYWHCLCGVSIEVYQPEEREDENTDCGSDT